MAPDVYSVFGIVVLPFSIDFEKSNTDNIMTHEMYRDASAKCNPMKIGELLSCTHICKDKFLDRPGQSLIEGATLVRTTSPKVESEPLTFCRSQNRPHMRPEHQ
jgi:hypothetical protein